MSTQKSKVDKLCAHLHARCSGVSPLLSLQLGLTSRSSIKHFTIFNEPILN